MAYVPDTDTPLDLFKPLLYDAPSFPLQEFLLRKLELETGKPWDDFVEYAGTKLGSAGPLTPYPLMLRADVQVLAPEWRQGGKEIYRRTYRTEYHMLCTTTPLQRMLLVACNSTTTHFDYDIHSSIGIDATGGELRHERLKDQSDFPHAVHQWALQTVWRMVQAVQGAVACAAVIQPTFRRGMRHQVGEVENHHLFADRWSWRNAMLEWFNPVYAEAAGIIGSLKHLPKSRLQRLTEYDRIMVGELLEQALRMGAARPGKVNKVNLYCTLIRSIEHDD